MIDFVPTVDVALFTEAMSVSHDDIITRTSQGAAMLVEQHGLAPWDAEPVLRRMQALHELVLRRPDFKSLPDAALCEAAATCPLIVPPANPAGDDGIGFDESAFQMMKPA